MDKEEKKKLEKEKQRVVSYQKKLLEKLEKEPKVEVIFQNLEDPVDVEFTYENVKKYVLRHGRPIKLPISVIKHLSSLKYPIYQYELDERTGQLKPSTKIAEYRNRFAFMPVNMASTLNNQLAKQAAKEG